MMVSRQLEQVLLVYYQLWRTSPFSVLLLQPQHPRKELVEDIFWGLIAVQNCIIIINLMILSNILLKITCSSERHSKILLEIMDQPCFSDVRFSKADMLSYCCFCISVHSNFNGSDIFGTIERCSR